MGVIDTILNFNAQTINEILGLVFSIIVWVLLGGGLIAGAIWLLRNIKQGSNVRVQIYEQKAHGIEFLAQDKIHEQRIDGVDYAMFKRHKKFPAFQKVKYPDSEARIHRGKGKTQLFCILKDGQVLWTKLEFSPDKVLQLNPMPIDQKQEFMQQQDLINKMWGQASWLRDNWPVMALAGVILANIIMSFFQFQAVTNGQTQMNEGVAMLAGAIESFKEVLIVPSATP